MKTTAGIRHRHTAGVHEHAARGFTLLELLIAISLGALLISTAFGAFRVAQGFITVGKRMATENAVMQAGYHYAMHEVDFWDLHYQDGRDADDGAFRDNDSDSFQRLVNLVDNRPMEDWWAWQDYQAPDPDDWHGRSFAMPGLDDDAAEELYHSSHGFYSADIAGMLPAPAPVREALWQQLGWYGYMSYLPSNAQGARKGWFPNKDHGHYFRHWTDWTLTTFWHDNNEVYNDPKGGFAFATGPNKLLQLKHSDFDYSTESLNKRRIDRSLLPVALRPKDWPELVVGVQRSIEFGERKALIEISAKSPVTGEVLALRFRAWGSTYRGARQHHGLETMIDYPVGGRP